VGCMKDLAMAIEGVGMKFDEDNEAPQAGAPALSERECLLQVRSGLIIALNGVNKRLGFAPLPTKRKP